jgi:type II secretion system protein G
VPIFAFLGCGNDAPPKIDGSSDEAFEESIDRVKAELSREEKELFELTIMTIASELNGLASSTADPLGARRLLRDRLDEMSAKEILELGERIVQTNKVSNQRKVSEIFVNQTAKIALTGYKLDFGGYPRTDDWLDALTTAPSQKKNIWKGPYLDEIPKDPWGNPYHYRYPGRNNPNGSKGYDIWSLGPDGVISDDDIGNW